MVEFVVLRALNSSCYLFSWSAAPADPELSVDDHPISMLLDDAPSDLGPGALWWEAGDKSDEEVINDYLDI